MTRFICILLSAFLGACSTFSNQSQLSHQQKFKHRKESNRTPASVPYIIEDGNVRCAIISTVSAGCGIDCWKVDENSPETIESVSIQKKALSDSRICYFQNTRPCVAISCVDI